MFKFKIRRHSYSLLIVSVEVSAGRICAIDIFVFWIGLWRMVWELDVYLPRCNLSSTLADWASLRIPHHSMGKTSGSQIQTPRPYLENKDISKNYYHYLSPIKSSCTYISLLKSCRNCVYMFTHTHVEQFICHCFNINCLNLCVTFFGFYVRHIILPFLNIYCFMVA